MATIQPFRYRDIFEGTQLARLPESLRINGERDAEILVILRLLSGSIDLIHSPRERVIKQRKNYFVSDFKNYPKNWGTKFPKLIGESISGSDLAVYIESVRFQNRNFYKEILFEISHYFIHEKSGSHTAAFIYLYRLLEKISYCFPLIYISKTSDFKNSYSFLKSLMSGNKDKGELGFFKTFVQELYREDPISETSIDLEINVENEDIQSLFYRSLRNICDQGIISENTNEPRCLSIKYCDMGGFLITVRNRFFHNLSDNGNNLEGSKIVDSDLLFSLINKQGLQWISTILLGVVSYNLSQFQQNSSQYSLSRSAELQ
jgi:hypothetical protein